MRSLFDPEVRRVICERIDLLSPGAQPRFGALGVEAMLVHVTDGLKVAFGELESEFKPSFLSTPIGRWIVIDSPFPWPKEKIKAHEVFFRSAPAEEFEHDRQALLEYVERFARGPNQTWGMSPFLGRIRPAQWARLNYRHLDHHLRQFGV